MSKGVYIGVDGYARKVKSMYIGVDGVARKIKKAYLGVEGYARLFYSSGGIKKVTSSISDVRSTHSGGASASTGSYAIFAGGGNNYFVDGYNASLTRSAASNLSNKANYLCGCGFNGYGVFAGGYSTMQEYFNTVEAYSSTLSKQTLSNMSYARRGASMAATTNYLVIFGGGDDGYTYVQYVETYTKNLTKSSNIQRKGYEFGCGVSCSGMAWFCDGMYDLIVFDDNMTVISHALSAGRRQDLAGAAVGNYVLFAGGNTGSADEPLSTIEAYNSDITEVWLTGLPNAVHYLSGTSVGTYALFGGGISQADPVTTYSDVAAYDENLTRTLFSLSSARYGHVSASVGDYALFAGGVWYNGSTISNYKTVEAFQYGG